MKVKNKKGWMMIVEAVIAVMILFGFVFIAMAKQAQETRALQEKPNFYDVANSLAVKAQENETIRGHVLGELEEEVQKDLQDEASKINSRLKVNVNITEVGGSCTFTLPGEEKEIYSASVLIATNSDYDPKKLCIFVWQT